MPLDLEAMADPVRRPRAHVLCTSPERLKARDEGCSAMDVRVEPRRSKLAAGQRAAGRRTPTGRSESVIAQLSSLLRALATSRYRRRLGLLAAGIVAVICANSVGQIRLNAWQGAFFDATRAARPGDLRRSAAGVRADRRAPCWCWSWRRPGCGRCSRSGCGSGSPMICWIAGWRPSAPISWPTPARSGSIPTSASTRIRGT